MEPAKHLDKKIGTDEVRSEPNRNGYGEGLLMAGERDGRVVALCADLTESTRTHLFAQAFPERFIQVGIAEQNMASVASGMASMGKIPFIASYAMFSPGRSWEQVRTTIAYNDSNVKIIGAHAGVSVGPDGATHQAIEDMAIMRVMPNMVVIDPCDTIEARKAVLASVAYKGPVYIRLGRESTPVVTTEASPFTIGKGEWFVRKDPAHTRSIGLIVAGTVAHSAMVASSILDKEGVGVSVVNLPTIKPLDTDILDELAENHDSIATVEEHQIAGGLGGAVAEYYSSTRPVRVTRIGIQDQFGQSGSPEQLLAHYGLDVPGIVEQLRAIPE